MRQPGYFAKKLCYFVFVAFILVKPADEQAEFECDLILL